MNLKKMKLRLASAALAAVMLTQCVPMNAFAKNGKEREKPELEPIKGYAVQAPREGNNTAEVEIPPTFVEKLQEISAGDRAEKIDSIEALSMPERTVENDRFLARMLHVSSYVDLTSEDASFLCDFLDAEEDSFLLGASYGFSLAESINYLELAKRISCDPETIFIMAPDEERCAMLRRQICLYEAILNPELTGSALDTQLRAQILSGHEAMEVIYAYGVSQALNQEIGYVLDHDSDMVSLMVSGEGIATDSLSQEDLPVRSYLQNKAEKRSMWI